MPFKSQAQRKKFYALEREGKISRETLDKWESETGKKKLPEKASSRPQSLLVKDRKPRKTR